MGRRGPSSFVDVQLPNSNGLAGATQPQESGGN